MPEASQNQLSQLCTEMGECCAKLDVNRCVDMRRDRSQPEIQQWVRDDDDLLSKMAEAESICRRHNLKQDADRLRELYFRLSDYMVGVLSSPSIGDLRGLCWAVKDLGELVQTLPGKLATYTTADLCEELGITSRTLARYVGIAGLRNTGVGERNRRYSADDRLRIVRAIVDHASEGQIKAKASGILAEIESKSTARK